MADLQLVVERLDDLPEALREFYVEREGKFVLPGVVAKDQHDSFRENNRKLFKEKETADAELKALREKYGEIDLDEYTRLKEQDKKLQEDKLIKEGDIDRLIEERYNPERQRLTRERDEALAGKQAADRTLQEVVVFRGVAEAVAGRINEGALTYVQEAALKAGWVADGHNVVRRNAETGNLVYGDDGTPQTLQQWVHQHSQEAPFLYKASSGAQSSNAGDASAGQASGNGSYPASRDQFTPQQKAAYVEEHGMESYLGLPLTRGAPG